MTRTKKIPFLFFFCATVQQNQTRGKIHFNPKYFDSIFSLVSWFDGFLEERFHILGCSVPWICKQCSVTYTFPILPNFQKLIQPRPILLFSYLSIHLFSKFLLNIFKKAITLTGSFKSSYYFDRCLPMKQYIISAMQWPNQSI